MLINLPINTKRWDRQAKKRFEDCIKIAAIQTYENVMSDPEKFGLTKENIGANIERLSPKTH